MERTENPPASASRGAARPLLVEFVGLPGAGKSTIFEHLRRRDPEIVTVPARRGLDKAALGWNVAAVVALIARRSALSREWTRGMIVMAADLRALPRLLEGRHGPRADVLAFDQGPIFALTCPPLLDSRLADWREAAIARWRSLLDVVVWLEAPDAVLANRINRRDKPHRLKGRPEAEVVEVLARERVVYQRALDDFERRSRILRFDTDRESTDEIIDQVLAVVRGV